MVELWGVFMGVLEIESEDGRIGIKIKVRIGDCYLFIWLGLV